MSQWSCSSKQNYTEGLVNNSSKMLIGRKARRYSGKYICVLNGEVRNSLFNKLLSIPTRRKPQDHHAEWAFSASSRRK